MTFDQINPLTGKVKEYANSAEWIKDVEKATAKPLEKKPEVKTFADAMKRYNKELGIRDPVAEKAAADADFIKKQVAEGIAEGLEKAQKAEKAQQAKQAEKVSLSPWPVIQKHSAQPRFRFYDGQEVCGCKAGHKPTAEPVIHSRRGVGPTMTAKGLTAAEAESRLKHAGITL